MNDWPALAARIVDGLPTVGGPILVRDRCGRDQIVQAVLDECETRGLAPTIEEASNERLRNLIAASESGTWSPEACRARGDFPTDVNGVIVLGAWPLDTSELPPEQVRAWRAAAQRAESTFEDRRVPYLLVAIPGPDAAAACGHTLDTLDDIVQSSLLVQRDALMSELTRIGTLVEAGSHQTVTTPGCHLELNRDSRRVLIDDGVIDAVDVSRGAVVSNLPAGSAYWTVLETETRGDVRLSDGTVIRFGPDGAVTDGPYRGERVSHLGMGANPSIGQDLGWAIVDEHRRGAVFLALGENRYMGGENASQINVDLLPATPTLTIARTSLVTDGKPTW